VFYNYCIGFLVSQTTDMSAPKLTFLTVARSQVGFDVGVRNFHFEVFLVDSRMDICHGVSTS
jgi:hypothetical protein